MKSITLIGMAGAGKSAVGKELAKELNCDFIDIDPILIKEQGLKLQEIIDKYGEEEFLRFEEKIILGLNLDSRLRGNDRRGRGNDKEGRGNDKKRNWNNPSTSSGYKCGRGRNSKYVISPGGSIIYSEKAMEFLKENSIIVFLDAPLEMIELRIKNYEARGIVGLKNKSIAEIFEERKSLYKKWADVRLKIENNMSVGHIAGIIISGFPLSRE